MGSAKLHLLFRNALEMRNLNYNITHLFRKIPTVRINYGKQQIEYQAPALLNRLHGIIGTKHLRSEIKIKSIVLCHDNKYV